MMKYEYRQFICSPCRCFACTLHEYMVTRHLYRGWVLRRNPDKSLKRIFLLAIHSHLYAFSLRFLFLQTHATSYSFFSSLLHSYTVKEKEENLIETVPPSQYLKKIHTETSSLRTLKIMPRNLNEIVRSWIRLQDERGDCGRCCAFVLYVSLGRIAQNPVWEKRKIWWVCVCEKCLIQADSSPIAFLPFSANADKWFYHLFHEIHFSSPCSLPIQILCRKDTNIDKEKISYECQSKDYWGPQLPAYGHEIDFKYFDKNG